MDILDLTSADVVQFRGSRNISRRALAEATGITEGKIWRIENKGTMSSEERAALFEVITGERVDLPVTATPRAPRRESPVMSVVGQAGPPSPTAAPPRGPAVLKRRSELVPGSSVVPVGSIDWRELRERARMAEEGDPQPIPVGPVRQEGVRFFSNSEVGTFKECRRKWWLAWYRGLTLKKESPLGALAIGNRIHRALAEWYVPDITEAVDPREALERLIVEDWNAVTANFGEQSYELAQLRQKFDAEADLERAMIEGYVEWLATTGADEDMDIIASETYLESQLHVNGWGDVDVRIIGKLDTRYRNRTTGRVGFIDHKSVANITQPRIMLPMNEQMLHYLLLEFLVSEEGDPLCDAALYNMLRKVKRTGNAKPPFYDRVEVNHSRVELESYRNRLVGTISDILEVERALTQGVPHQSVAYPRPSNDCTWKCPFVAVCPMFDDGSRVEDMLKGYYRQRDPLEYYGYDAAREEGTI